jgi:hypothetical protein
MTTTSHRVWGLLWVGAFVVSALGCASTSESARSVGPTDLASLAGTWQGTASGSQGLSQPVTMRLGADGTFTMTGGVYTSQGNAEVRDGKLLLVARSTTGAQSAAPTATAVLSERREPSQVVQVLTGSGASAAGPYSFVVSRPKE